MDQERFDALSRALASARPRRGVLGLVLGATLLGQGSLVSAKPGKVTIRMDNPSSVQHAVSILGNGVSASGNTVGSGGVSTVTATLPAGRYDFFCPVDGHKQAGMNGRLIVK